MELILSHRTWFPEGGSQNGGLTGSGSNRFSVVGLGTAVMVSSQPCSEKLRSLYVAAPVNPSRMV